MKYTDKVIERFKNPKYLGELDKPNAKGKVGNPVCGDVMEIQLEIKNNIIKDVKVKTFGCVAAISTSDVVCELALNKKIDEALKIKKEDVIAKFGELPPEKIHCSLLALDALKKAIEDYKKNKK
ncbi:iron-sulfur cluster assembly scaffold protein [Candidatus Woesearchaeota archaeon]|nr:iron-sulfur cluster assembly scaffold protein [Candidatus Woesearchaeota archaeon]